MFGIFCIFDAGKATTIMKMIERYQKPLMTILGVCLEQGFAATSDFEQPEFGGEDNIK